MGRYADLVAALRDEVPGFRIVRKDQSRFHRALHWALVIVTLGRMRNYLDSYHTTIRRTVYVTSEWDSWDDDRRYVTLRHEAVHLRQFRTFTLPGMIVLYLLVPFPMGLAWCRAAFEKAAYAESIRAAAEVWGASYPRRPEYRAHIVQQFVSASYGWMWPFRASVERWYESVLANLDRGGPPG